jgi:MoxR-like ATPase
MSTAVEPAPQNGQDGAAAALEGGSYEVIRARLLAQAKTVRERAGALNDKRKKTFGGIELTVIGNERVRTENNCVPRDIVAVGGHLLFGYNVFIGLKTETQIADVFSLHDFVATETGFELPAVPSAGTFLDDPNFVRDFKELYKYYKDTRLLMLRRPEGRLLAVFQVGQTLADIKVFRWAVDVHGAASYIDNRGERDHVFPPSHDFEWTRTTREDHVSGRHPHVSILDQVFVETIGGDLTIKVENNTQTGRGVYAEPVEDKNQSLDDGEISYAQVGALILLKIKPFREERYRYLVFNTRTQKVARIDAIGQSCLQLPENHGIIFPGGYYLQTGETKVFDLDPTRLDFKRVIRSPNGEDVLYVFRRVDDGSTVLFAYNLIQKEVQNPIRCHGYSLFADGKMVVFRASSDEPTRVHPMQVWRTPFMSPEHAAQAPVAGSFLAKVGNADLVRGVSDALTVARMAESEDPTRKTFEDLIAAAVRVIDAYHWLGHSECLELKGPIELVRSTAELIVDEFEKVQAIKKRAREALAEAQQRQDDLVADLRPEDWRTVDKLLDAMTALRKERGHLITLRELRYMDLAALKALEDRSVAEFERVSKGAIEFLQGKEALAPLVGEIRGLLGKVEKTEKTSQLPPLAGELDRISEGLSVLSEVLANIEVEDPTVRTAILESISEIFAQANRARATLQSRRKELLGQEGRAEFGVQFKLYAQSVQGAIALADTPEKVDEQLSRVLVQLEELEGRFSEFDDFLAQLTEKREEVYEAFGAKKQTLVDERQRRAQNLSQAAERILSGIKRRAEAMKSIDDLNAYFASDPMILKLRQIAEQLLGIGDSVKADEIESKLKASKQDALRGLRDRLDLFEGGGAVIQLGRHRFNTNTQPFELTVVPRGEGMAIHLTGTDFYEPIDEPEFNRHRDLWEQQLISETPEVYRGEYLAATILFAAEAGRGADLVELERVAADPAALLELVRRTAGDRYDEGYERGVHDADAAAILGRLVALRASAGLLRFAPRPRARAAVFWAYYDGPERRASWHRRALSLGRLREGLKQSAPLLALGDEIGRAIGAFFSATPLALSEAEERIAGRYLAEELTRESPRFAVSREGVQLAAALRAHLDLAGTRAAFEEDLKSLEKAAVAERVTLIHAWLAAFLAQKPDLAPAASAIEEAAAYVATERRIDRAETAALTHGAVEGLLGNHPRIRDRRLELRLDELLGRLWDFADRRVPAFREYRKVRHELVERHKRRLRIEELMPKVLTSFVRNRLISEVYLPLLGDNLAKQLGAVGEKKRTDLMGMLLLVSPPGYGKTTLMEYLASRLGMVFMKVNGPALGHQVTSIDPAEAPNATARQEVEKINLALEMGNNVMLYLDDIQHTNPELLQKFISLCDAQRRIEGVWNGRTRTYDLRGKKFCVCMAGNPYTESGEKFQIPDMLANRADTYNLGDILTGKDELFALSYLENALTSNGVLAPLAGREPADIQRFIRMAQGKEVPASELAHNYSAAEIEEIVAVFRRLFQVQATLLKVNQQYIASASQDDAFRTEPPFKLQGSYRNMNKLTEKVVSAMTPEELERLIDDHYQSESQTLTTGAEQNLLKLAELRGRMTPSQKARWEEIKSGYQRVLSMGGKEEDPVTRVTGQLASLVQRLDQLRDAIRTAAAQPRPEAAQRREDWVVPHLERLDQAVAALAQPRVEIAVQTEPSPELQQLLAQQVATLEQALLPLVRASSRNLEEVRAIGRPLLELIELMKLRVLEAAR